jgi:hypothetical protein
VSEPGGDKEKDWPVNLVRGVVVALDPDQPVQPLIWPPRPHSPAGLVAREDVAVWDSRPRGVETATGSGGSETARREGRLVTPALPSSAAEQSAAEEGSESLAIRSMATRTIPFHHNLVCARLHHPRHGHHLSRTGNEVFFIQGCKTDGRQPEPISPKRRHGGPFTFPRPSRPGAGARSAPAAGPAPRAGRPTPW